MALETHTIPGARFVDPQVLARIRNLELLARTVVDGFINGLHRAPYFGASIDFAEHRGYVPGDDIRRRQLEGLRAHGPLLRQAIRGRHERELLRPVRRVAVDGLREPQQLEARVSGPTWRHASPISPSASATGSAS